MRSLSTFCRYFPLLSAAVCMLAVTAGSALLSAGTFYWGSDTTGGETTEFSSWQDTTHWFDDAGGVTASTGVPGALDRAIFSVTSLNATALVPRLFANTTVNAITFNNTAGLSLTGSGNRDLAIGSGGVTTSADAANITFGTSTANRNIRVKILESQTWTNNSAGVINIRNNAAASDSAAGPVVLTLNAASTGGINNSGAFSDGAAGSLGLIVDSAGTGVVSIQSSAYTGGTIVKRGVLATTGNIGANGVLIGDTSGSGSATIRINSATTVTNNFTVQANNSGTQAIEISRDGDSELSGAILLNKALALRTRASRNTTLSGVISGSGALIKDQYNAGNGGVLILSNVNTYSGDTTILAGTLTLNDDAALTFYIGANGVNNRIGVNANVFATKAVNLNGDFIFDLSQAAAVNGNVWSIVDVAALTETYGATFNVQGFTNNAGVWTQGGYTFTQATGQLVFAVPEPSSFALLLPGLGAVLIPRRRRQVAACGIGMLFAL